MPGGSSNRSSYYEGVLKIAPIIALVLFVVVIAALVRNFIDDRVHPDTQGRHFDAVRDFRKVNSVGLIKDLIKKPDK